MKKIFANEIDKGLISKIYKQLMQLNKTNNEPTNSVKKWAQDLNRHLSKTYGWPTNRWKDVQHHLLLEKWKSKTTMMYHLILIRMSIIKKSTNNKYWRGCREKGTPPHCWKEYKLGRFLWRVWRFPKKLKTELPYDPAILFLGIYLEEISYCVSSKHW